MALRSNENVVSDLQRASLHIFYAGNTATNLHWLHFGLRSTPGKEIWRYVCSTTTNRDVSSFCVSCMASQEHETPPGSVSRVSSIVGEGLW